jgi:hypothetical protein
MYRNIGQEWARGRLNKARGIVYGEILVEGDAWASGEDRSVGGPLAEYNALTGKEPR